MKIVLIGANHSGIAAANTILGYGKDELTIFDRNSNISYLGCGTALWVGKQISGTDGLFYSSPEALREKGARVFTETAVGKIDFADKKVYAENAEGQIIEDYDKLILATGSLPIEPKIPGTKLKNVHFAKLFQDGKAIDEALANPEIKSVAVVGAGYIGVELAEAVVRRGKRALLFDVATTSVANYYDPEFSTEMDKVLADRGVELHFGEAITEIEGQDKVSGVKTGNGSYAVEMVLLCIGFVPNTDLGKDDLQLFPNKAYHVNRMQQTSLPDVYAVGDCATVWNNATGSEAYIALATNAVRSGLIAGHNVCGTALETAGVQGSNGISIFGWNMFSTGLSLGAAKKAGFDAVYTEFEDFQKPGFIAENNNKVKLRIVYDKATRRVLGAQMASRQDVSMGIHMFSLAIEEKITIDKLALLDIFFLPHFNQPYNYITMAALSAK